MTSQLVSHISNKSITQFILFTNVKSWLSKKDPLYSTTSPSLGQLYKYNCWEVHTLRFHTRSVKSFRGVGDDTPTPQKKKQITQLCQIPTSLRSRPTRRAVWRHRHPSARPPIHSFIDIALERAASYRLAVASVNAPQMFSIDILAGCFGWKVLENNDSSTHLVS